jgi:hypothetical protein
VGGGSYFFDSIGVIMTTFYKIPPHLPFYKGRNNTPL